jgi:tetratricopeptide (TPR) repeat protein
MTRWFAQGLLVTFCAAAAAASAFGCGGSVSSYRFAIAEATRAQTAGRFDEAGRAYERASHLAESAHDRAYTEYLSGLMRAKSGDREGGLRALDHVAQGSPATDSSAEAMYRAACLRIEQGESARGYRELETVLHSFPSHGVARSSLTKLLEHVEDTGGLAATIAWLETKLRELQTTELGQVLAYRQVRILEQLAQSAAEKREVEHSYVRLADAYPYPKGVHYDEALFRASELAEKDGRGNTAIGYLERLLRDRESSHLMGTYERPLYSPAQKHIALICEDSLQDPSRARAAWHHLYAAFQTSTERDDALFREAQLWKLDGDPTMACRILAKLAHEFPQSRYAACAIPFCPFARPEAKGHTSTCNAYVARAWAEGTRIPNRHRSKSESP